MRTPSLAAGSLLAALAALAALPACTGDKPPGNTFDTSDTGLGDCGRVRGTNGVLMYDAADPNTVYYPTDEATDDVTTGIAGPIDDAYTFLAVQSADVLRSVDIGCNWEKVGSLPDGGDWQLVAAGTRVYAFDQAGGSGAVSDDGGGSWSPFSPGGPFAGVPTAASVDPGWLRGVTAAGVATTTDGAGSWSVTASLPMGLSTPAAAAASPGDLDRMVLAGGAAVWVSANGGLTWDDRTKGVLAALNTDAITAHAAAMSPDDAAVLAAIVAEGDGTVTLLRSPDAGATWQRLADSAGIRLATDSRLWIPPGHPELVLAVSSAAGEEFSLHLNVSSVEAGTHVVKTQIYDTVSQVAFSPGAEGRYLAGVSVR